jgi:hypothetical protein
MCISGNDGVLSDGKGRGRGRGSGNEINVRKMGSE